MTPKAGQYVNKNIMILIELSQANTQSRRRLMTTQLAALLNGTVLVAIPALFADTEARRCRLVAVEQFGLWLVSAELAHAVQPGAKREEAGG